MILGQNGQRLAYSTVGFNPYYQTSLEISEIVKRDLLPNLAASVKIEELYYYGAGCERLTQREVVKEGLRAALGDIRFTIDHDLLAAARALFHDENGIACIAGTGANTCLFMEGAIVQNIYSPGLALGDEGSGGYLGKLLARDYIRKALPPHLMKKFEEFTPDRTADILDRVYKKPFPNRYLASFAPFVAQNQSDPYMHDLAYKNFEEMFDQCICRYDGYQDLPIRFVGSVAAHMKSILEEVADAKGAQIDKVMSNPMEGLVLYHLKSANLV
jgi:N-acetylglucosamine kinase-like BadF-type ATPase